MKHKRILLAIVALLIAASPMLVQGVQHAFNNNSSSTITGDHDSDDNQTGHGHGSEAGECEHPDHESAMGAAHEANKTNANCPGEPENDHDQDETVRCIVEERNNTDVTHSGLTCDHPDHESQTGAEHEANVTAILERVHEGLNETRTCNDNDIAAFLVTSTGPTMRVPYNPDMMVDQVRAVCA